MAVVLLQAQSTTACTGSPVKPLATRVDGPVRTVYGMQAAPASGGGWRRWCGCPGHRAKPGILRDAARDAPGPSCHKPKTPIGRRGVSLT